MSAALCYFVKGDDPSLVDAAARRLLGELDPGDLAVEDYRIGESEVPAVLEACRTPPFLTERRVVVLRDAATMPAADAELVAEYLANPLESTVLILVGGSGRLAAALARAVKSGPCEVIDTAVPSGAKGRAEWIATHLSESGLRLDARSRELIGRHFGEDVERLDGLVATLRAAFGPGARVGEEEVEPFLGSAGDVPPWELTDAIDRGDTAEALRCLRRMTVAGGRAAVVVLGTLHRHFESMLALDGTGVATDSDAAQALGITSVFRAGKVRKQALRLGSPRIARALNLLADADLDLKGRSGWPTEAVLEVLVARLSRLVTVRTGSPR